MGIVVWRWKFSCLGKVIISMVLNKVFYQVFISLWIRECICCSGSANRAPISCFRNFDFAIINPTEPMQSTCNGIFVQKEIFLRVTDKKVLH
jgi:hypothetical protein